MTCKSNGTKRTVVKNYSTTTKGDDGSTPYIGINDNWWIDGVDTGISAKGISPTIGLNGNWYIGGDDTGVKAVGQDGENGQGVPTGGGTGQVLVKSSVNDYDTEWTPFVSVSTVTMDSGTVYNDPTNDESIANKKYVDDTAYHSNKSELDTIDQNLASTDSPTFVNVFVDPPTNDSSATNKEYVDDLFGGSFTPIENRLTTLENILAPFIGGGGMVLWNKPANQIPTGWAEVVDWRGRIPVGLDTSQTEFNTVGKTGGSKTVTLLTSNMPPHNHNITLTRVLGAGGTAGYNYGNG